MLTLTTTQNQIIKNISKTLSKSDSNVAVAYNFVTTQALAKEQAKKDSLPYIDVYKQELQEGIFATISLQVALEKSILPIKFESGKLTLVIDESGDFRFAEQLQIQNKNIKDIEYFYGDKFAIHKILQRYIAFEQQGQNIYETLFSEKQVDYNKVADQIIADAILSQASDIHIYPEQEVGNLFFRIDGVLNYRVSYKIEHHESIVNVYKQKYKSNSVDKNLPQDGNFTHTYYGERYDIRASTLPTQYGENLVMRLLYSKKLVDIEALGISKSVIERMRYHFAKPKGLILVTGPTGSGKSTTLHSLLGTINVLERHVISVENPIEYKVPFIRQSEANKTEKYTFSDALKAIMRQDPDVIFIGEVRDEETAQFALEASMTGHLVISTLHTNDAVGSITRLENLGIPTYLIADGLRAVTNQRLVRKLCNNCKESHTYTSQQLQENFGVPMEMLSKSEYEIFYPKGCSSCHQTGYSGREMVVEFFEVDEEVQKLMLHKKDKFEIRQKAQEKGMVLLKNNAIRKVLEGVTSFDEIERVI